MYSSNVKFIESNMNKIEEEENQKPNNLWLKLLWWRG